MTISRRLSRGAMRTALLGSLSAGMLRAQQAPASVQSDRAIADALAAIKANNAWTIDQQVSICEIPAPPFKEQRRAEELKRRFESLGLSKVRIDAVGNVIGERPGTGSGPTIVLAGHLDTVFPEGTDVKVKREGTILRGPGIADDCRGLAVLLTIARAFNEAKVVTDGTILFVGDVGEEGAGNLRGTRHLVEKELKGRMDYFISVDGSGLKVTSRAVGSIRYRVHYRGPGGHSFGAFGIVNPNHALGRAIARIADLQVPESPKTTFNVGIVSGGSSVNAIPAEATMDIDMRSESPAALAALDGRVRATLAEALAAENARWPKADTRLTLVIDTIGIRPAGAQPDSAPIVRTALAAARALGFTSQTAASSTDANVPMALGIPAITLDGGGREEGSHSLSEYFDDGPNGWLGPQWVALVVASLARLRR